MASEEVTATSTTPAANAESAGGWVRLSVGGTLFETTRTTLARLNSQFLDRLLAEDSGFSPPADGVYMIDRDPEVFRVLLNYARNGQFILSPHVTSDMIQADAEFYMLRQGALEAMEGLDTGTASFSQGRGKRHKVPAEVSIQYVGAEHHNGLIFRFSSGWTKTCSIDKCTTKMFNEDPKKFSQMCISCHRYVVVEEETRQWESKHVAVEWCHKCLRCLDCQEIVCLP